MVCDELETGISPEERMEGRLWTAILACFTGGSWFVAKGERFGLGETCFGVHGAAVPRLSCVSSPGTDTLAKSA